MKWKLDAISASYEGTFAADGNAINGTMTQGPTPMTLNLTRATPQTAWAIPEPPPPPKPMDPAADPGIEVSTVKLSPPDARGRLYTMRGTQLMAINTSVMNLITFAYDLHEKQISAGPSWISSDRFEVVVKPDIPGQPNISQMKRLFQKAPKPSGAQLTPELRARIQSSFDEASHDEEHFPSTIDPRIYHVKLIREHLGGTCRIIHCAPGHCDEDGDHENGCETIAKTCTPKVAAP